MISWREFVREVQRTNNISYREAMTRASALWKKKPDYEKKTKSKSIKGGIKKVPEISQFPTKMRFSKKKPGIYASPKNLKRKLPDILTREPLKRQRSINLGPIDTNRFKYSQVGSNHVEV